MRATMTCPGRMIPGHVGLCYMPLDWTSARPCIFFAAHRGSVCLAQADCYNELLKGPLYSKSVISKLRYTEEFTDHNKDGTLKCLFSERLRTNHCLVNCVSFSVFTILPHYTMCRRASNNAVTDNGVPSIWLPCC